MTDVSSSPRQIAVQQIAEGQMLIEQVQSKMRKLADEFAAGEINREQFYKIYEHYQTQINLATAMIAEADVLSLGTFSPAETIAIRKQLTGKAKAAAVYYHETSQFLETIGDFELPVAMLTTTLTGIADEVERRGTAEPVSIPVGRDWVLFVPGQYSTAIMVFSNEPVMRQVAIVQNMHHNFETANQAALRSG